MWISKQLRPMPPTADTDLGTTTIQGEQVGVMTRGEVRALPVYGPGGYVWMPENGAAVLVVKGGPGGEEQCVAGMRQASPPKDLEPGEVYLHSAKCSICLRADGSIQLRGDVDIRGTLTVNGEAYVPCRCGEGGIL